MNNQPPFPAIKPSPNKRPKLHDTVMKYLRGTTPPFNGGNFVKNKNKH